MASIINASTSGAGGVVTTADASGQLELQTASTTAITVDASQNVGIGTTSPSSPLHIKTSGTGVSQVTFTADLGTVNNRALQLVAPSTDSASEPFTWSTGNSIAWSIDATERVRINSSGLFQFDNGYGSVATAYGCRAWVNFNGTGTVAIRESGNVSSITDNGTGWYRVNFTTAMPDANYAAIFNSGTGRNTTETDLFDVAYTEVTIKDGAGATLDQLYVSCAIFR